MPEKELEEESESTQSDDARSEDAPHKLEIRSYKIWTLRVSKAQKIEKEVPSYHMNLYVFGGEGKEPISTNQ